MECADFVENPDIEKWIHKECERLTQVLPEEQYSFKLMDSFPWGHEDDSSPGDPESQTLKEKEELQNFGVSNGIPMQGRNIPEDENLETSVSSTSAKYSLYTPVDFRQTVPTNPVLSFPAQNVSTSQDLPLYVIDSAIASACDSSPENHQDHWTNANLGGEMQGRIVLSRRRNPTAKKRKRRTTPAQRKAANIRERRRMFSLNDAFDQLKKKVPRFDDETKLSRIETLKLAIKYIDFMTNKLKESA